MKESETKQSKGKEGLDNVDNLLEDFLDRSSEKEGTLLIEKDRGLADKVVMSVIGSGYEELLSKMEILTMATSGLTSAEVMILCQTFLLLRLPVEDQIVLLKGYKRVLGHIVRILLKQRTSELKDGEPSKVES